MHEQGHEMNEQQPRAPRAVVTGAARGIGAAISRRLEADGYEVVRLDASDGPGIVRCDIRDEEGLATVAAEVGPVDVLVNNAGIWRFAKLEDVTVEDFRDVMDVNVLGAFLCARTFGKSMLQRGSGSIVNLVSIAAAHANVGVGAYSASKAGLLALTRTIATEWGPRGVRCNAVGPGLVPTPGTGDVYDDPAVVAARSGAVPLRRLGTPEDIAEVVCFLAGPKAAYVNGQVMYVDGGLSQALMTMLPRPYTLTQPTG